MTELTERKATRFAEYDYNTSGAYFLTICTKNKKKNLSKIVGDGVLDVPKRDVWNSAWVELEEHGIIVERIINQLNGF